MWLKKSRLPDKHETVRHVKQVPACLPSQKEPHNFCPLCKGDHRGLRPPLQGGLRQRRKGVYPLHKEDRTDPQPTERCMGVLSPFPRGTIGGYSPLSKVI